MPSDPHADELRRRAGELQRLASRLGAVPLADLDGWAGPDTWSSPGAEECRAMSGRDRQRVAHAVEELLERASGLVRQADTIDAVAAAARLAAPVR